MNIKDVELKDVSLIIATYNEEESLGYVLDEIKDLTLAKSLLLIKAQQIIPKILRKIMM